MWRRRFIVLLGGAAASSALPWGVRAQQSRVPIVGVLGTRAAGDSPKLLAAFRQVMAESGYVEGRNLVIEERWANNDYGRLPALAAELVRLGPAVIFACAGAESARAARAATSTIPVVFDASGDPVADGLVASMAHPGGNVTGVNFLSNPLAGKRLELLRDMVPSGGIAVLCDPRRTLTEAIGIEAAAKERGLSVERLEASSPADIERAFTTLAVGPPRALLVTTGPLNLSERTRLVERATRERIPTIYFERSFVDAGGLLSYGASPADTYRQCGAYVVRILNGDKPGDLPVMQPTRFELVVNLKAASAIGLTVPPTVLIAADEVIE